MYGGCFTISGVLLYSDVVERQVVEIQMSNTRRSRIISRAM